MAWGARGLDTKKLGFSGWGSRFRAQDIGFRVLTLCSNPSGFELELEIREPGARIELSRARVEG